jgi:hypothetical protein
MRFSQLLHHSFTSDEVGNGEFDGDDEDDLDEDDNEGDDSSDDDKYEDSSCDGKDTCECPDPRLVLQKYDDTVKKFIEKLGQGWLTEQVVCKLSVYYWR